jgi:hypothetical protein
MPKVIYNHNEAVSTTALVELGEKVRPLVAALLSTPHTELAAEDIDWIPVRYPAGSLAADGIEIETIGYADRKRSVTSDTIQDFKTKLLALAFFKARIKNPKLPFVWLKWQDPDGYHV